MGGSMSGEGGGLLDGYLNARDMFDGGGAGKSGSEFKGGGLLSAIANAIGKPLGSRDRQQQKPAQPMQQRFQPQPISPAVSTGGPRPEPQQTYTFSGPPDVDVSNLPPQQPMQYGPPARALAGPNLRDAMNPQANKPDDLLRQFEADILRASGGAQVAEQMRADPALAEKLLLEWIRNDYKLPGA